MNNSLNEYLRFNFELNIELNHFLARFNVKMNNQNVSATPNWGPLEDNIYGMSGKTSGADLGVNDTF